MGHQTIGPLGLLDRVAVATGQGGVPIDADVQIAEQKRGERIAGQRGQAHAFGGQVLARTATDEIGAIGLGWLFEPNLRWHRLTAVTGVARDAGFGDVVFPAAVDVLRHLDHAPRHHLGVLAVFGQVGRVVAIGTALGGRHPAGHGNHQLGELRRAQVAQHLDVLIDLAGLGTVGRCRWQGHRGGVQLFVLFDGARVVHLHHACATVAALHRVHGRAFARAEQDHAGQGQAFEKQGFVHGLTPIKVAGSTTTGNTTGYGGATPCLTAHRYQLSTTVPVSKMPMPPVMGHSTANHQAQR